MAYIIAEIGQAHEGSLGMALSYIEALKDTGIDAVKFQVHIAEAESSEYEPFRIKFSEQDKTRFDYWKRMSFSKEEWLLIKKTCEENDLEFLASPFSNKAVDLLEDLAVKRFKIGSGEVNNFLLLKKIASTGKPVILSSGMSSYGELDKTVKFLKDHEVEFSLLQCTTAYPTKPEEYGLNVIGELKKRYDAPVGFSDHSGKISTCIAAAVLGAEIFEFHVTYSRMSFGPDASSSIEINEVRELVNAINDIETAVKHPVYKSANAKFDSLKDIFEKSLAVNKELKKGHILRFEDLESKKPKNKGIDASKYERIIGKKINKDLKQWDFLTEEDLQRSN